MSRLLIQKYIDALKALSQEKNLNQETIYELRYLCDALPVCQQNHRLLKRTDAVPGAAQYIGSSLTQRLQTKGLVLKLINLLARQYRLELLPEIAEKALKQMKRDQGIHDAVVTSARDLDGQEKDAVNQRLNRLVKGKTEIDWIVDPEVLGGFHIKIGDTLIDGTVRTRLLQLQEYLDNVQGED